MEKVMIKKMNRKFKGYNEPHQCHKNAYNYCYDHYGCKFVVGYIMNGSIAHCIVQTPEGKYIDPTLNERQEFIVDEIYDFNDIMKIFSNEQMYFIPNQFTMNQFGEIVKYNKMKRIVID